MEKILAMEQSFAVDYLAKIENATQEDIKAATDWMGNYVPDSILSIDGDTAAISITGPLSRKEPSPLARYFGYGGTGYNDIIKSIDEAEEAGAKEIKFLMDTPGGDVTGVDLVAKRIDECKIKTTAVNMGLIASAGYWIASACDEITALEPTSRTGSIGVVITSVDYSKMYEEYGIKIVEIVSKNAPNKRPDINTKKGISVIQEQADAIENVFIERVSKGRNMDIETVKSDFAQGGILIAQNPDGNDAIKAGMIDGMYKEQDNTNIEGISGVTASLNDINETTPKGEQVEENMDLKEFLASNPTAKAEYNASLETAKAEGVEAGKNEVQARIKKVAPIMASDSYDFAVKAQAQKALDGTLSIDAFESVVAMEDMRIAREKGVTAVEETKVIGETPAATVVTASEDGIVNSEQDYQAIIAKAKNNGGIK